MRYISHYEEYPIYEPAEGGYYYPGNQLMSSERKSKRACKQALFEIWEQCQRDNIERGFREDNGIRSLVTHMNILGLSIKNTTSFIKIVTI